MKVVEVVGTAIRDYVRCLALVRAFAAAKYHAVLEYITQSPSSGFRDVGRWRRPAQPLEGKDWRVASGADSLISFAEKSCQSVIRLRSTTRIWTVSYTHLTLPTKRIV